MKRLIFTLVGYLLTILTSLTSAQEQEFETVMTPAFSPITWERLVNAKDAPHNSLKYS